MEAGALPLLIDLCRSIETVAIGLAGLVNLTCLHEVRVNLITEGVFEKMISLLLDEGASKVSVNTVLDSFGRMCLEAECAGIVRANEPLVDLVRKLSRSESAETKRFAESILNNIAR